MKDPKDKDALTPEVVESNPTTMVNGRQIQQRQLDAFRLRMHQGLSMQKIANELGVDYKTVFNWVHSEWWKELSIMHYDDVNDKLRSDIVRRDGKLVKFYDKLLDGKLSEDKSAGPTVKFASLRFEMGSNPLVNRKGSLHVDTMINNTQNIVVNKETTKDLSQSDLLKIITGEMPVPESMESDDS